MKNVLTAIAAMIAVVSLADSARATVIASTDFDGRTVSGSTASNLTWVVEGVADPGDLTAQNNPDGLFDTANAQDLFAVNRNLHNEGDWLVNVPLVVGAESINLTTIELDAYIFDNNGAFQPNGRDLDLDAVLVASDMTTVIDTDTVLNIYPGAGAVSQPEAVSFDLSGNTLPAGETFFVRVRAYGQGPGNNAGIDNLVINGDIVAVPEPATAALGLLGLGALGATMRRRRA